MTSEIHKETEQPVKGLRLIPDDLSLRHTGAALIVHDLLFWAASYSYWPHDDERIFWSFVIWHRPVSEGARTILTRSMFHLVRGDSRASQSDQVSVIQIQN